ncbi:MAG: hypothetical protein ACOZF0_18030 [Thermodesulfobacteriota bacterium]
MTKADIVGEGDGNEKHAVAFMMKTRRAKFFPALMTAFFIVMGVVPAAAPVAAEPAAVIGTNLDRLVNGVLTLMGYSLTPDVTTGSLSFSNAETGNPGFAMTSLGAGFTVSKSLPVYLEGTAAFSRYDPTFVLTDGVESRSIPFKWNSLSVTVGVGWDFPMVQDLVLRPIVNCSLGHVESDASISRRLIEHYNGQDMRFLNSGHCESLGLGGSLMLDYERYRPENEIDVELRYTNIYLQSISSSSELIEGDADTQSLSLWSRWRAPTGLTALKRPVRYVLEFSHTQFLGDLRGALGFDWLSSMGAGFELDSSAYRVIVTRTRILGRYKFGDNVQGWSIGIACSF